MTTNNLNQQQLANRSTLTTPLISMEQFVQYQLRQEEIERNRMRDTMSNMIQTFFPNCNFDINLMLPTTSSGINSLPQSGSSAATVSSSTQMPLPRKDQNESNSANNNIKSKHISWAIVLSLKCAELQKTVSGGTLCKKELATEEEMQKHLRVMHGIRKYRCLNRNCTQSFDRRKFLDEHVTTYHQSNLLCRACPKRVSTSSGIEGHYQLYHQKGLYQCIRCKTIKEYLYQMRRHTKECSRDSANNYVEQRNLRSNASASSLKNEH